MDGSV
jgi:hypothetical protein